MKNIVLLTLLLSTITCNSKEVDLLCRGTYRYVSKGIDDKKSREINFTFDDVREIVITESSLFCMNREELKGTGREFTKKRIYSISETAAKTTKDEGYCSHSYDLNRHSGKLETTKIENYEGIVVIQNGI